MTIDDARLTFHTQYICARRAIQAYAWLLVQELCKNHCETRNSIQKANRSRISWNQQHDGIKFVETSHPWRTRYICTNNYPAVRKWQIIKYHWTHHLNTSSEYYIFLCNYKITKGVWRWLKTVLEYNIKLLKYKDLRTVCSQLKVRGVKNATKDQMTRKLVTIHRPRQGTTRFRRQARLYQQERSPRAHLDFSTFCFQTHLLKAFLNLGM